MKQLISFILLLAVLLCGCSLPESALPLRQFDATFLTLFDTVTTIRGFAENNEAFTAKTQPIHDELLRYHQLFDIYNDYEGVNNLKTINDNAGIAPVEVDPAIIEFILDCKEYYILTDGRVNIAMGSVLSLWHRARTDGINDPSSAALPDAAALEDAAKHTDIDCIVIDEKASTVFLTDPEMSLDVGAVAKGWSVEKVCSHTESGLLISVGGNICATGPKDDKGTPWVIGIQDPDDGNKYLHTLNIAEQCVVTSGDYQRCYVADGKVYHHIIDPNTLYPSEHWSSVSIICEDSGLADVLSTALFLLPFEEGRILAEKCGAEVIWVTAEREIFCTDGIKDMIRT